MRKKQLATRTNFNEQHSEEEKIACHTKGKLMESGTSKNDVNSQNDGVVSDPVYQFDSSGTAVLEDGTVVVEPVSADIPTSLAAMDCLKGTPNSVSASNLPMVKCTVCGMLMDPGTSMISIHPILQVIRCQACAKFYRKQQFVKDADGKDENCRWCADGGDLICCDHCSNAFCKRCIKRNLGRSALSSIESLDESSVWSCYICDPSPIQPLQKLCTEALIKVDEFRALKRRRSDRGHASWRTRSNLPVKGSEVTASITENASGSLAGTVSNSSSADTLKALTSIFSQLSQSVDDPNKTVVNGLPDMGNLLQLMGRTITNVPSNTPVATITQPVGPPGWVVQNAAVGSDGRPTALGRCLTANNQQRTTTHSSVVTAAAAPTSANSEIAAILNQITSVDESNIHIALKAARRCIETFSADIHRLEQMSAKATTIAEIGRVVRSFHSIYRFHLFARLSNLSARMREELPKGTEKSRLTSSSTQKPNSLLGYPSAMHPLATPISTVVPLTIDLTDETDVNRETRETRQSGTATTSISESTSGKPTGLPSTQANVSGTSVNNSRTVRTVKSTALSSNDRPTLADTEHDASRANSDGSSAFPTQPRTSSVVSSFKPELNEDPSSLPSQPSNDSPDSTANTPESVESQATPGSPLSERRIVSGEHNAVSTVNSSTPVSVVNVPATGSDDVDDLVDDDDDDIDWKLDMLAHLSQSETAGMVFNADAVTETNTSKPSSPGRVIHARGSVHDDDDDAGDQPSDAPIDIQLVHTASEPSVFLEDIRDQLGGDSVVRLTERPQFNQPSNSSVTALGTTVPTNQQSEPSDRPAAAESRGPESPAQTRSDSESDVDLASLEATVSSLERRCENVEKIADGKNKSKTRSVARRTRGRPKLLQSKDHDDVADVADVGTRDDDDDVDDSDKTEQVATKQLGADKFGKPDSTNTSKARFSKRPNSKSAKNSSIPVHQKRFTRSTTDTAALSDEEPDEEPEEAEEESETPGLDKDLPSGALPEVARNDLLRDELLTEADAQYRADLVYRDRLLRDSSEDEAREDRGQDDDQSDDGTYVATPPSQTPERTVSAKKKSGKTEHTSKTPVSRHAVLKSLMATVWSSSDDETKEEKAETRKKVNDADADDKPEEDEDLVKPRRKRARSCKVRESSSSADDSSQEMGMRTKRPRAQNGDGGDESRDSLSPYRIRPRDAKVKPKFGSINSDSEADEDSDSAVSSRRKVGANKSKTRPSGKRRRRVRLQEGEEEERDGSEVDEDSEDEQDSSPDNAVEISSDSTEQAKGSADEDEKVKGRRKIRKIYEKAKLSETTKTAEAVERERRKRLAERQKLYNDYLIQEGTGIDVITKKLVLEKSEDGSKDLIEVHPDILKHLKPHQVEAVRFLWDCVIDSVQAQDSQNEQTRGAILAHCMGLGKTLSVIAFLHTLFSYPDLLQIRTCLVICPVNTLLNWKHEWEIWLPADDPLDVFELSTKADNRQRVDMLKHWHNRGGVMLLGYDMFRNFVMRLAKRARSKVMKETVTKVLLDPGPDIIVCDEGHVLKNCKSALSKSMSQVRTLKRIVLTGTPLQNNLTEYHAMVNFVKPNLLGTAKEFNNRFANPIKNGQHSNSTQLDVQVMKKRAHVLYKTLDGCVQRKDYAALTKYLPPRYEYVIMCRLSTVQQELYRLFLQHRSERGLVPVTLNDEAGSMPRKTLFTDQQTLYRVWTHPFLLRSHESREARKMLLNDDEDDFIDDEESTPTSSSESTVVLESSDSSKDNEDEEEARPAISAAPAPTRRRRPQRGPRTRSRRMNDLVRLDSDSSETEALNGTGESNSENEGRPFGSRDTWWSVHYRDYYDWDVSVGAKLDVLLRLLKKACDIGDKMIIFTQSLLSLDLLEKFLGELHRQWLASQGLAPPKSDKTWDDRGSTERPDLSVYFSDMGRNSWVRGVDYERMDGSTNAIVRKELQTRFNRVSNTQLRLFLISTRAGGLGINLIAANRVILFDACWNPSHDVQSIFRSYRFGQTKPVYIYRLIAQGTMEEKIYDRQVTKQSLSLRVIDEQQIDRHFSNADLQALYTFEPDVWDPASADQRPTPKLPKDRLLADMLSEFPELIVNYHEHDSLLEHREDEGLTEEQRQEAWREYEEEKLYGMSLAQHQRVVQQQQEMQARMLRLQQQQQLVQQQQQLIRAGMNPPVPSWTRAMMNSVPFNPFYPALRTGVPVPMEHSNTVINNNGNNSSDNAAANPATTVSDDGARPRPTLPPVLDQQGNASIYYELFDYYRAQLLSARPSLSGDPEQLKRLIMGNLMDHLVRTKALNPGPSVPTPVSNASAVNQSGPSVG